MVLIKNGPYKKMVLIRNGPYKQWPHKKCPYKNGH